LLLQIEFLIAVSNHEHDGKRWTYQSLTDLRAMFPFWSIATIQRAIKSLEEQHLITIGNYNKLKYDKTRWFALDPQGFAKLTSVSLTLFQNETPMYQNETSIVQNETRKPQNETTIPETTTKTKHTSEEKTSSLSGGEKASPPEPPAKTKTPRKKKSDTDPRVKPLLVEFEKLVGYPLPNYGQEGTAAKLMLKTYQPKDILACWKYMQKDNDFWKDKHCGLSSVNKQIGKWLEGQNTNGGRIISL